MDLQEKLSKLQEIVYNSKNIVFFGGAGVSTESGLKDFRSRDGLYNEHYKYPPEEILSHDFFFRHTEEFYRFYRDKMLCLDKNVTDKKIIVKLVCVFISFSLWFYVTNVENPNRRWINGKGYRIKR